MGAQLVKEVSIKTNDIAGDGTTTATLLAQALIREGMKNVTAGANPMVLKKGIADAVNVAVEAVKKNSKPVQTISQELQQFHHRMNSSASLLPRLWKRLQQTVLSQLRNQRQPKHTARLLKV